MPWPTLAPPVAGTVITVARELAMNNDPLAWLRLLTGNADPPGPHYVVVSTGTAATTWGKISVDELGPGAALGNLGYTPINKAGDSGIGTLGVAALTAVGNITSSGGAISAPGNIVSSGGSIAAFANLQAGGNIVTTTGTIQGAIINATTTMNAPSMTLTGALSAASATLTGALNAASANISGAVTSNSVSAVTIGASGNITASGSIAATANLQAGGNIVTTTGTVAGAVVQASSSMNVAGRHVWEAGDFDAPTPTPTPGRIPLADAGGKLDAWVTPTAAAPVPSGLIAFIAGGAASTPTGWTPYTALNGRVLLGAGSAGVANNQTFTAGTSYPTSGANWGHADTVNLAHSHAHSATHNHGAAAINIAGHTGAPNPMTAGQNVTSGAGGEVYVGNHSHDATADGGTMDVTGTTDAAAPGSTDSAGSTTAATIGVVWIPPSHALTAIIKS